MSPTPWNIIILFNPEKGATMKKRLIIIILLIVSFVIIYAFGYMESINNTGKGSVNNLKVNIPYAIRNGMSASMSPYGIEKKYGKADILRRSSKRFYEIRNMNDGSKLIVIYSSESGHVIDLWQLKKLVAQDEFHTITIDKSDLNDILKIDPYATLFEKSDKEATSEHRLKDNKSVLIDYSKKNGKWIIENLNFLDPDPSGFTDTISSEDQKLIS